MTRAICRISRIAGLAGATLLLLAAAVAIAAPEQSPPEVIVAEAQLARFVDRVEALGTLKANESVAVTAVVTETVTKIHFDDGDRVKAGQVLVEMTSAEEHALLQEVRATVEEAQLQYSRVKSLEAQGTEATSLLDQRHRELATARARLTAVESRLADRLIKAPFDGVVGLRDVSVGTLVEPGDVITTLDDDRVMKLDFTVPSAYLSALAPGLPVVGNTRAYGDRRFEGEVRSVASRVDPVTRSVVVRAVLPNPDRSLKPGMLMKVVLLTNPRESVSIPEEALAPLGPRHFVNVVDGSDPPRALQREVAIGARQPGFVEILDGLSPGERVITQGVIKLRPGQAILIQAVDDGSRTLHELLQADSVPGTTP